jgi:hypothetical protein
MPIDERTARGIGKLASALPGQSRILELAMLAGNGLAAPLARVRANQARREVARTRLEFGSRSPEYAGKLAEAQAANSLSASIDAEIERLTLDPPVPRDGEVAVYGYVRDNGKGMRGVAVALVGGHGQPRIETKTAADGSFSLTGAAPVPLGLAVGKGNSVLSADADPRYTPAPRAYYRVIDVGDGHSEKAEPAPPPIRLLEPPKRAAEQPDQAPYDGLTLNQALDRLAEEGRPLSHVILVPAPSGHGHVIGATMDVRNGAITLELATGEGHSERLDALAVLVAQDPAAEDIGLGTIEQARERLRTAEVETLSDVKDLLDLSDATIARKAEVRRGAQAKTLRTVLQGAFDRLEPR